MQSQDFGIYILSYPGDFHLSRVLVRSIQGVSPDIPIMIIPGEGFDRNDHPFDVPIMPEPPGFWGRIGHQDRDFWAFQGPFETFLYLDADTICTKSLDGLVDRITKQDGDFFYIQPWIGDRDWRAVMGTPGHPEHDEYRSLISRDIGTGPLTQFDPGHDFYVHCTFNAGVFASRRLAIGESDLESLNRAERAFYRDHLGIADWNWKSSELFFRDQGRLNYLVRKLAIPVFPLEPDVITPSGARAIQASVEAVKTGSCGFHIIHWMGAMSPSPSLFCSGPLFTLYASLWSDVGQKTGRHVDPGYKRLPECPGYSLWRYYHDRELGRSSWRERLRWSGQHLRRTGKLLIRILRLALPRCCGRPFGTRR